MKLSAMRKALRILVIVQCLVVKSGRYKIAVFRVLGQGVALEEPLLLGNRPPITTEGGIPDATFEEPASRTPGSGDRTEAQDESVKDVNHSDRPR